MRAGLLRHQIYIRQPQDKDTAKGDREMTYDIPMPSADIPNCFAEICPLVGRELIVAKGIRADLSHKIRMRYLSSVGITPRSRLYWYDGTVMQCYNVGPAVDFDNRQIEVSYYGIRIS